MNREEILQIAKRCYPVGTEYYGAYAVKGPLSKEECLRKVTSNNYKNPTDSGCIYEPSTKQDFIYHDYVWAEIVLPEPKIGMRVVRGPKYMREYVLKDAVGTIKEFEEGSRDCFTVEWDDAGVIGTNTMCMNGVIPYLGEEKKPELKYSVGEIVWTDGDNVNHFKKPQLGVITGIDRDSFDYNYEVHYFKSEVVLWSNVSYKACKDAELKKELFQISKCKYPDKVEVNSLYDKKRKLDLSDISVSYRKSENYLRVYDNGGKTWFFKVKNSKVEWAKIIGLPSKEEFKIKEEIGEVVTPLSNGEQIKLNKNGTSEEVQNSIEQISRGDKQGAIIIQSKQSKIEVRDFDPGYSRVIVRSKRKIRISEG